MLKLQTTSVDSSSMDFLFNSSNIIVNESFFINESFTDIDSPFNCSLFNISIHLNSTNCTFPEGTSSINMVANIVLQICYALAFVVGLCGNSLVIYVIIRFSKMQTVTNFYILNLAVADELFVFGIPFLMITSWIGYWSFGFIMCKIYMTITSLNQFTSSLFLTIMSADRYIAVCHPINSPKFRTPLISKLVAATAWTTSAFMIVPVFLYAQTSTTNGVVTCNIFWTNNVNTIFTVYSFILAFGIPVLLFFIFYSLVLLKLRTVGPASKSKEKKKSHRKVTKMVLTVITVYVFCYLPYWVLQLVLLNSPPKQNQSPLMVVLFVFSSCLTYVNSAINPILYAFLSDNFKKSFMKACTCAARNEANSVLQFETSVFPRRYRRDSARPSRQSLRTERKSSITPGVVARDLTISSKVTLTPNVTPTIKEEKSEEHRNGHPVTVLSSQL
ncbi:Somatostatin receptor type 2 [Armadillidium nasatum]|uniref:Somatostatin receptor type 2 n=1 Tax=Armadillidium nasatum TaxID=96803 RepID=A0A5N5SPH8_9CRUS|nr:Somatostatin receptor type 2 [Armadillidium nasatum]